MTLYVLLKKGNKLKWAEEHIKHMERLKGLLTKAHKLIEPIMPKGT